MDRLEGVEDIQDLILSKLSIGDLVRYSALWPLKASVNSWVLKINSVRRHIGPRLHMFILGEETLAEAMDNNFESFPFVRACRKFVSITGIDSDFWTKENMKRFVVGDFIIVGGNPIFQGSRLADPLREMNLNREQQRMIPQPDVYKVQIVSGQELEVFEYPIFNHYGDGIVCLAPTGTVEALSRKENASFVRCIGGEYFSLTNRYDQWLESKIQGAGFRVEPNTYIVLHVTAALCLPRGQPMTPIAVEVLCKSLRGLIYSSMEQRVIQERQLKALVEPSAIGDGYFDVQIYCLAINGDGLGTPSDLNGGLLAYTMAEGLKREIHRRFTSVTMGIRHLDAWYECGNEVVDGPATYIVRGLYQRCQVREIFFWCSKVYVALAEGNPPDSQELIEIRASPDSPVAGTDFYHLFQEGVRTFLRNRFRR